MRPTIGKILITSLLVGAPPAMQPFAEAQTARHNMSRFIAAYQDWKNEQARDFRMRAIPQAQERAIITYAEHGECAVVNGFLFGVGWHHIPDHEQYTDDDVLRYARAVDRLVEICEAIR